MLAVERTKLMAIEPLEMTVVAVDATRHDGGQLGAQAQSAQASAQLPAKLTKAFRNRYLHKAQRQHFLLCNLAPLTGTALALALISVWPPNALDVLSCLSLWAFTLFCVVAGYHRHFTHRSYEAHASVRFVLHAGGLAAAQGSLISWVALHRRHHECSDGADDPHSPMPRGQGLKGRIRGLLHSQLLWMYRHDYPNVQHYVRDLLRDRRAVWLDRYYYHFVYGGVILPGAIGFCFEPTLAAFLRGMLWGGLVRIFLVGHAIGAVNSLLHAFGRRRFETHDNSRNSGLMAFFTFGDSYHNNHHAFPSSASAGLEWYHPDPAYWAITFLSYFKLTWNVQVPSRARIAQRTKQESGMSKQRENISTSQDSIAQHIRSEVAGILDTPLEKIDVSDDIDALGLNSSVIVSLVGRLEEHYRTQLSPTLFFENGTIARVAYALSAQLRQEETAELDEVDHASQRR